MKKLTRKEHVELYDKVENEGFGYYMFQYGPDINSICRLGFDKKELEAAINLFKLVEEKIYEVSEFADALND